MESKNTTQIKIYDSAKELFYINGYDDTSLKDIAEKAEVPISLITYYFKKKLLIASQIYSDFLRAIKNKVNEFCKCENLTSALLKCILMSCIIYDIILSNENNKKLYMQLKEKNHSFYNFNKEVTEEYFIEYIQEYGLSVPKQKIDLIINMNSLARCGFFDYYNKHNLTLPLIETVDILESMVPLMMGIPRSEIDKYLLKAQNILREIDYSDIKLLI